ncbi:MAG TPA: DedA family protein [Ktedonobacteraceae bacterium]|nr:DedA family protein [Ktedonobacteraceae bacterium]
MLQNITTAITTVILHLYATTGLAGIVLAMSLESCLIPLPSEIVMPLAGVIIGSYYTNTSLKSLGVSGSLQMLGTSASLPLWVNLILVALAGAVGCLIGSIAAYGIGYAGGRPLVLKYGRFLLISQHDTDVADRFFLRWGSPTAFFSRLLPVVRTYISLPAGITRMPFGKFCLYSFLGSLPWSLLLAFLGTLIGANLDKLSPYFHDFDIVIIIALVALLALYIWRHIRNDRKAREAHALEAVQPVQSSSQQQNGWNQQQQGWGRPAQTPQQGWGQPMQPPSQHQQPPQQQVWGQQNPQQVQQGWGQPVQPAQPQPPQQNGWNQSFSQQQPPAQQGWGQPVQPAQPPQPNWGQPVQPGQQGQQFQPPPWSQNGDDKTVRRG